MRLLKKYPNRRLYDTKTSQYVTLQDVREMVLAQETIQVVDSKTDKDLTRSVLLQIISELEGEGHEPLLTNRLLESLIRFYGDSMQGILGRYLEQALSGFLEQQAHYQKRMREVLAANPLAVMQRMADHNLNMWRSIMAGQKPERAPGEAPEATFEEPPEEPASDAATHQSND
ncbi:MAG: polyhydroxyalkanoate synthesis repressor PhaR [Candidatus Dadabacteria bacterium]|nr:MAG: polyhydroxyalkanoate synthesis repressor PhaR [Candidatus Dadabacteria bacterium]